MFDDTPEQGHMDNQLMFYNSGIDVGQGDLNSKTWIILEVPKAMIEDFPHFCIRDIQCYKSNQEKNWIPFSSADSDNPFDPTSHTLIYDSKVTYRCGAARGFRDPDTDTIVYKQEFTCNWDAAWEPTDQLMSCECKYILLALALKMHPDLANLCCLLRDPMLRGTASSCCHWLGRSWLGRQCHRV